MIFKAIILAVVVTIIVAEHDPANSPCTPGSKFNYYCNQCACDADGKGAACTRMACYPGLFNEDGTMNKVETGTMNTEDFPALPKDMSCVAGQMYKKDCNTCRCIRDDVPICTLMACVNAPD
ncbi:pacifastin-like protease inhibitor cvp4 [Diachasma alloeum]|uniref:pacifastin-like protease inhibitor cvp4 n=1 Tax=Diachasma alloeum TaxID=454923 RepID=UPI000738329D|nr:pacifastin-like protease inhibitor cvp4 [Diachasma alloeum]